MKNTDRRVSIKQNQPIVVEYLCEKRPPSNQSHSANASQPTANGALCSANARPASLILTKGERPMFKLIRSPSIDQEQDEALNNVTNYTDVEANQSTIQRSSQSADNNAHHLITADNKNTDDDDEDESAPLVQNAEKDTTKITSSANHS